MPTPPAEFGIDFMNGAFVGREPNEAYAWLREHDPVFYDEPNDIWGVTRYRDVKAVSTDTAAFSNAGGSRPKTGPIPMMIDFDAPEHVRRRRLVSAGFTPARVREMEGHVRDICDWVLDQVCERGSCDFVRDIAAPLPLMVIGDMLGMPHEDRADLLRWSEDMLRSQGDPSPEGVEAAMQAFAEYSAFIGPVLEDRRRSGDRGDLVGILCQAELDGDRLDDPSLVHETLLILIGGDETTRHVITGGMHELQRRPEQLARLREDRSLVPVAVEEMLRWVTPIKNMTRTATRDVELAGRRIRKGQQLLLVYPSANRDPDVFDEPEEFDIARSPNPHMAFGFGAHFCLGNQLARLELRVMFDRLLTRLPDLAPAGPGPLPRRRSNFISGFETMPVTFTPSAPVGAALP